MKFYVLHLKDKVNEFFFKSSPEIKFVLDLIAICLYNTWKVIIINLVSLFSK